MTGIMGEPLSAANETVFRDLARELRAATRSEKTISAYHQACLSLERYLVREGLPTDLLSVTRRQAQGWLIALQETHAKDSIVSYFGSARRFFNWAAAEELITKSPMAGMATPAGSGKPVPIPDTDDIRKILAACAADKSWRGRRDEAIIRMFCQAGAPRCSEVAGALIEQTDMEADMITVTGKGGKIRAFPLEPKTARSTSRWLRIRPRVRQDAASIPQLFIGSKGALTTNGVYQMTQRRCDEAGVERLHPHQYRHWSTDQMLEAGMQEGQVMILNGWSSRKMLDRYGKERAARRAAGAARAAGIGGVL